MKLDENFEEDFEALIEDLGLDVLDPDLIDSVLNNLLLHVPTDEQIKEVIKELDGASLDALVEYYKVDLEMYGYSAHQFYQ